MPFDATLPPVRPTTSELWRRVEHLTPRLATPVRIHRQRARGQVWHVVEDPLTHRFARLDASAHAFVARLDGRRTTQSALDEATSHLKEDAPTRAEAVQILSQLHEQGLLHHDQHEVLEPILRKRRSRKRQEFRSSLGALLFIRVPLFNPNRFFDYLLPIARPFVSWLGLLLWGTLLALGLWAVIGASDRLGTASGDVLDTANLPALVVTIAIIKLAHEFGHALLLKALARSVGGARVPRIGVLLLLFLPFPYVDASGAWALRSKWARALVGAGGMIVEVAIGAMAGIVWANAAEGSATSAIAFNALIASTVSTVLFNANPLLRYDGYHILCDLLGTPNLAPRATRHFHALLKRRICGVNRAESPARDTGEGRLLLAYALASGAYRMVLYVAIGLFIANQQLVIGGILLTIAAVELIGTPLWRCLSYLGTSDELATNRARAVTASAFVASVVIVPILLIPLPRSVTLEGVVADTSSERVYARESGTLREAVAARERVRQGEIVAALHRDDLERDILQLESETQRLESLRRLALRDRPTDAPQLALRLGVIEEQLAFARERLANLSVVAGDDGAWHPAAILADTRAPIERGLFLGTLIRDDARRIVVPIEQSASGSIESARSVQARGLDAGERVGASLERIARTDPSDGSPSAAPTIVAEYRLADEAPWRVGTRVVVRVPAGTMTLGQRAADALRRVFDQAGQQ